MILQLGTCNRHVGQHSIRNYPDQCVNWIGNFHDDGYTKHPTHLRVYRCETGDEFPWHLDGADNVGRYTEDVSRFRTMDECFDAAPQFLRDNAHLTWAWDPQRRAHAAASNSREESDMSEQQQPDLPEIDRTGEWSTLGLVGVTVVGIVALIGWIEACRMLANLWR